MQSQGDRIRSEREAKGLTQAELAKMVSKLIGKKITQQSINQLESGKTTHPLFFSELCQALEVPPAYIRTGEVDGGSEDPPMFSRQEMSDLIPAASPRSQAVLRRLAKANEDGELTDSDLQLLEQIANRIKKKG